MTTDHKEQLLAMKSGKTPWTQQMKERGRVESVGGEMAC